MRQNTRKHSEENPGLVYQRLERRKEQVRASAEIKDYKDNDLKELLLENQGSQCFYCRGKIFFDNAELEHKIPLVKNGLDIRENIVLACFYCNREKHGKTIDEYRAWKTKNGYSVSF